MSPVHFAHSLVLFRYPFPFFRFRIFLRRSSHHLSRTSPDHRSIGFEHGGLKLSALSIAGGEEGVSKSALQNGSSLGSLMLLLNWLFIIVVTTAPRPLPHFCSSAFGRTRKPKERKSIEKGEARLRVSIAQLAVILYSQIKAAVLCHHVLAVLLWGGVLRGGSVLQC